MSTDGIRNAPRALILRDDRILLLKKHDDIRGDRYALPGGAQESGETLEQALVRECREEIGCDVMIRDLVHVADYFKPRATVPPSTRQLVEFLFLCDVPGDYRARNGHRPDKHQVDVVWMPVSDLAEIPLLPRALARRLRDDTTSGVYWGTVQ